MGRLIIVGVSSILVLPSFSQKTWGRSWSPPLPNARQETTGRKYHSSLTLAKFNMSSLEDDVVGLMEKRVVDLAATLGKGVKVELNGKQVSVQTFTDYVDLYLKSANKKRDELPRIAEKVNNRWEVCTSLGECQFQQVSFVNGIHTIKGGTHVDYVTSQITNHVAAVVNEMDKNANLRAHIVKNHLWVFVNAIIENPVFDSQTKEDLDYLSWKFWIQLRAL